MALKIIHKNSSSPGTPPVAGDVDLGEIAINAADAELYTKDTNGNIQTFRNAVDTDAATQTLVTDQLAPIRTPEVVDYNKSPIYQLESSYQDNQATWLFAHTGQSLAEGGVGDDAVTGLTPYPTNVEMLSGGPVGLNTQTLSSNIVTLAEKSRVTIASSYMRNVLDNAVGASDDVLFHGQAWGGKNYNNLKKGGSTGIYEKILAQALLVNQQKPSAIYKGISIIHGEQDGLDGNTSYAEDLAEWQNDFNSDLKNITGQSADIPAFFCQVSSSSGYGFTGGITSTDFPSQLEQLRAHKTYSNIFLVCPKYHLDYFDHSHITNNAQRVLGEYYAKAFTTYISTGSWEPLRPATVTGSGNQVFISFEGRVGNLVFDTSLVNAATHQGFAYYDDLANTILNVSIVSNQVVITLSGTIGANATVSYAYNNGDGGAANQIAGNGARGNLRDSDTAVSSFNGARLYNWCVIFKEAVL